MEIAFPILLIIFIVLVIIIPSIIDEIIFKQLEKEDISEIYGIIRYNKDDNSYIRFILGEKCVETNTIENNEIFVLSVDMQLLKAINKKVEELG